MRLRFDFVPSVEKQNIEIPIDFGLTSLHAEFEIHAPADPLGRIVSIFGLRGNLEGKGRKKKRVLHFNKTQGQDHQDRWEAEITAENEDGQERGPKMPFPGTYQYVINWTANTGVAESQLFDLATGRLIGSSSIVGPKTAPITSGFLYIGGHVSKPPAPGEPPVYTAPIGCRLVGFVEYNGEKLEDDNQDGRPNIPSPPITNPPVVTTPPVNIPTPITPTPTPVITTPSRPNNKDNDNNDNELLGLSRHDLISLLRSILDSLERDEKINLRIILAQVLGPILIAELLKR